MNLSNLTSFPAMDTLQLMALAGALGWASGVRLYLVVLLTGLAGFMGWVALPQGLHLLQHPLVLGAAGFMVFIEFFADKIPMLDSLWDGLHTFIRIPAGAALAASVFGFDSGAWGMAAGLLGGTLAAGSHVTKATTRAAINTSPEPFSNIGASLAEDALVPSMLWLSVAHPVVFFGALALVLVVSVVLLRLCWRFIGLLKSFVLRFFGGAPSSPPVATAHKATLP